MRVPIRLAITVLVPLAVYWLAESVLLPNAEGLVGIATRSGIDAGARANLSVFALGAMPLLTGYAIVEAIAFLVPRLSRLRHGNPAGRVKLERAARAVALVLAVFQAWGIGTSLRAFADATPIGGWEAPPVWLVIATLVGGLCVLMFAIDVVTRQGIANGLVLFTVGGAALELRGTVIAPLRKAAFVGNLDTLGLLLLGAAFAIPTIASWYALRAGSGASSPAADREGTPYRGDERTAALAIEPWIPIPSSSLAAYTFAASLLMLPLTLASFGIPGCAALANAIAGVDGLRRLVLTLFLVLVVANVLARVLHRPRETVDLATRLGHATRDRAADGARRALGRSLLPTALFFVALVLASGAAARSTAHPSLVFVPLAVALALDVIAALRAPNAVVVWQERRASAVPVVRAVLEGEGIPVVVRGMAVQSLLQIFAPYAPAEIAVAPEHEERAVKVLRHRLLGEAADYEHEREAPTSPSSPALRPTTIGLAVAAVVGAAVGVFGLQRPPPPPHIGPRPVLEVVRVDDTIDPLEHVADEALPPGIEIRWENAPIGDYRTGRVHFARATLGSGQPPPAAIANLRTFAATIPLPVGARWAFQYVEEVDDDGLARTVGARTFVVVGPPVLTTDDVVDAEPAINDYGGMPEIYVAVVLSSDGGARFAEATGMWIDRRMAIVLDGVVESAPVIKSRIPGGRISITMGRAADYDRQLEQARNLANGLRPR